MEIASMLFYAGILLIFAGIVGFVAYTILIFAKRVREVDQEGERAEGEGKIEGGGIIFIGPIPIVFGSNRRVAKWMLFAAIVLAALLVFLTLLALGVF